MSWANLYPGHWTLQWGWRIAMRRRAMTVGWGFTLLLLASEAGCGWLSFRHRGPYSLAPEQMVRFPQLSEQAQQAVDKGDPQAAQAILHQLVALDPRSAEAMLRLGKVLQLQGQSAEAEACFKRALEIDRDYPEALIGLGQMEANRGGIDSALERFRTAIELEPNKPDAHMEQGRVLEAAGRTDEAIAAYFRASEFNPNQSEIALRIGSIQLQQNQPDQALVRFDQVVELAPGNSEARLLRGRANLMLRRLPDAISDLKFAVAQLPNRPDAHYYLALALEADNRRAEALESANRASKLAPDFAGIRDLSTRLRR